MTSAWIFASFSYLRQRRPGSCFRVRIFAALLIQNGCPTISLNYVFPSLKVKPRRMTLGTKPSSPTRLDHSLDGVQTPPILSQSCPRPGLCPWPVCPCSVSFDLSLAEGRENNIDFVATLHRDRPKINLHLKSSRVAFPSLTVYSRSDDRTEVPSRFNYCDSS